MDAFSYLSVLLSIIVGLAITQVLQGYRLLLLARHRVRLDPLPLIWSLLMLVFATQSWWASFGLTSHKDWSFLGFAAVELQFVLLYVLAGLSLPDVPAEGVVDLRAHYDRERIPFFLVLIAVLASSLGKDLALDGRLPGPLNVAMHGAFAFVAASGAIWRRRWVQVAVTGFMLLGIGAYIVLLFSRL